MKRRNVILSFWLMACFCILPSIYGLSKGVDKTTKIDQTYEVQSPSGILTVQIRAGNFLSYSISYKGLILVKESEIAMKLDNGLVTGENAKVKKATPSSVSEVLEPVVQQKSATIPDVYNQLKIEFEGNYTLYFRVYDDGVAYRWEINIKEPYKLITESVNINFDSNHTIWFPEEESFLTHQERHYKYLRLSEITADQFCSTGILVDCENGLKMYISESDLEAYPGMYLKGSTSDSLALQGLFAPYPLETEQIGDRTVKVTKYADYIARVDGPKAFPWRIMIITYNDAQLLTSQMIYKLASPNRIKDVSWIKPGKIAWDWWNDNNIYGVDFKSGINTNTYKYYIDFASAYGLEYIILDEGWYYLDDVLRIKENVDVKELIRYGKEKDVGVILWVTWKGLEDKMEEAMDAYADWGAVGIKVDFMQRDDQIMVEYYYRVAEEAVKRQLLVDFHGSYKPTGWLRTYPNVLTSEGVQGMEHCKWSANSDPEHNVTLPFIRMVAGPMDYTPGAIINATKADFKFRHSSPMSLGTRCHQLGMYVVYESPLQMLADNPSNYYREPECMEFLSEVPTVWDETIVLKAKAADYVVTARRSGETWFLGGMTDWDPRIFNINLNFLDEGEYSMRIWKDGVNADRHASDYQNETLPVERASEIEIKMAPGGGWAAIIEKK